MFSISKVNLIKHKIQSYFPRFMDELFNISLVKYEATT